MPRQSLQSRSPARWNKASIEMYDRMQKLQKGAAHCDHSNCHHFCNHHHDHCRSTSAPHHHHHDGQCGHPARWAVPAPDDISQVLAKTATVSSGGSNQGSPQAAAGIEGWDTVGERASSNVASILSDPRLSGASNGSGMFATPGAASSNAGQSSLGYNSATQAPRSPEAQGSSNDILTPLSSQKGIGSAGSGTGEGLGSGADGTRRNLSKELDVADQNNSSGKGRGGADGTLDGQNGNKTASDKTSTSPVRKAGGYGGTSSSLRSRSSPTSGGDGNNQSSTSIRSGDGHDLSGTPGGKGSRARGARTGGAGDGLATSPKAGRGANNRGAAGAAKDMAIPIIGVPYGSGLAANQLTTKKSADDMLGAGQDAQDQMSTVVEVGGGEGDEQAQADVDAEAGLYDDQADSAAWQARGPMWRHKQPPWIKNGSCWIWMLGQNRCTNEGDEDGAFENEEEGDGRDPDDTRPPWNIKPEPRSTKGRAAAWETPEDGKRGRSKRDAEGLVVDSEGCTVFDRLSRPKTRAQAGSRAKLPDPEEPEEYLRNRFKPPKLPWIKHGNDWIWMLGQNREESKSDE